MKVFFPNSFILGVGDADLQAVGEDYPRIYEHAEQSMWDFFAREKGITPPGVGVDRYHRWKEDINMMSQMGVRNYRTSVSMARLLKKNGQVNKDALNWYRMYFKELTNAGIKIYVTLYHWELPQYLNEVGGWTSKKAVDHLLLHSQSVVQHLGEYIDEYFILNEPWCSSMISYFLGVHAPGEKSLKKALSAAHNLLLAQGYTVNELLRENKKLKLSTVINVEPSYSFSLNKEDLKATSISNGYLNRWFSDPLFFGEYPAEMVEFYGKNMPAIESEDMKVIKVGSLLNSLGINFYHGNLIKYDSATPLKFKHVIRRNDLTNGLHKVITIPPNYPESLSDTISEVYFSYKNFGLKRIYITENGTALNTPLQRGKKIINDSERVFYLQKHLKQIHDLLSRNIPVEGYFTWTLMDNFEWAEGYKPESAFGLIHVDRKTMKRTWKKSAYWYKNLIKTRALTI